MSPRVLIGWRTFYLGGGRVDLCQSSSFEELFWLGRRVMLALSGKTVMAALGFPGTATAMSYAGMKGGGSNGMYHCTGAGAGDADCGASGGFCRLPHSRRLHGAAWHKK